MLAALFRGSYFSLPNPLERLQRWRNPFCHSRTVSVNGKTVRVRWTDGVQQNLAARVDPLCAEMQLLFSCVVKKRVIFHDDRMANAIDVNNKLSIVFSAFSSEACDPERFASAYPVDRELSSGKAGRMVPTELSIACSEDKSGCTYSAEYTFSP